MATLMLFEDNPAHVRIMRMALMPLHTVYTVSSWKQATPYLHDMPLDLALIDLQLPHVNGYEICSRIHDRMPCIAISAFYDAWVLDQVRAHGFDGFLGKPFDPQTFPEYIAAFFRGERLWHVRGKDLYTALTSARSPQAQAHQQ